MKEIEFGVITFKSTHYAIQGDIAFREQNINYRTIPTPREITRSCGLAIKFDLEDIDLVKDIIEKNKLTIDGIFKMVKDDQGYKAERLN